MQIFPPPQCVDEIMEDMPERRDLLPKNVMKVPEVFHYIVDHHKGRRWRREEEGRGRGDKGEEEGGKGKVVRGEGIGEEGEGVYIHCIVTMSLCLCSDVKKS